MAEDPLSAAIVLVSSDPAALRGLGQELAKRYSADYEIVLCGQPSELESQIRDLLAAGIPVALVIGGVGAQDPDGIEVLAAIRSVNPTAPGWPPSAGASSTPRARCSTRSRWARSITG